MNREDIQKLAEEMFSLQVQSSEASDREDYGAARLLEHEADTLETQLQDAGYTLKEDSDNLDIIHVLDAQGTRYGTFDLASWTWLQEAYMQQFAHGDRVEDKRKLYGTGTVIFLDGDLMVDGSGRTYNWPGHVCVEFDREINGEKPAMWCEYGLIRKIGE